MRRWTAFDIAKEAVVKLQRCVDASCCFKTCALPEVHACFLLNSGEQLIPKPLLLP
jgi:hypothetical protein